MAAPAALAAPPADFVPAAAFTASAPEPALPAADVALMGSVSKGANLADLLTRTAPELPAADSELVGMQYRSREGPPDVKR
jgi:hypothetical protein